MAISTINSNGLAQSQILTSVQMPAGSVLQVVNATYNTTTATTSTSTVATGLTATITPKFATSKILVMVNQSSVFSSQSSGTVIQIYLFRNGSTQLLKFEGFGAYGSGNPSGAECGSSSACYLDSPATTSATTYAT